MNEFKTTSLTAKEISLDISSYPTGTYFCKLTNGNKVHTTKFIKY